MGLKATKTSQYILEKVSPVFNRRGYFGTTLSDITAATGLTKGAIYGNFKNKEQLALAAFNYNVSLLLKTISREVNTHQHAAEKLMAILNFYKSYLEYSKNYGGCPLLNKGMNMHHQEESIGNRVKAIVVKIKDSLEKIISDGVKNGEIKEEVSPNLMAGRFYSMLNGGIYLSTLLQDQLYLDDMIDQLSLIVRQIKT